MIYETIVSTQNADGSTHIAPMGIHAKPDELILAPFKPSITLDNVLREKLAVINYTTDTRIFADRLTRKSIDWPLVNTKQIQGKRLSDALAHAELRLVQTEDDAVRPRLHCEIVCEITHQPFRGFNRAQSAVIELAILVSRLERLPAEKIDDELAYLQIAIDKTAGEHEITAWGWLMEKLNTYREDQKP